MDKMQAAVVAAALAPPEKSNDADGNVVATQRYLFNADFLGFQGHFPGAPILPGVVQNLIGICFCEAVEGRSLDLFGIDNAKFMLQLGPDMEITVNGTFKQKDEKLVAKIKLEVAAGTASAYQLTFMMPECADLQELKS
jgi:3-hydroxyacyl-[acyl-carrier-protein] dehydratase